MRANTKGQLSLGDAPSVVMIVGLTFLVMATLAFIGVKYADAIPSDESAKTINETLTSVTEKGKIVAQASRCNFEDFAVVYIAKTNATGDFPFSSTNYTQNSETGAVAFTGVGTQWNNSNWKVTYTFNYAGTACNVTQDLNTEIENNTSIAGIILTISLVGIVLTVLIGIFVISKNRGM
jgi:hypothetical protein